MFIRRWAFIAGVLLFIAGVFMPFAVRVAAGVAGLNSDGRYDTTYYTDLLMILAVVAGGLLIIVGVFVKPGRPSK